MRQLFALGFVLLCCAFASAQDAWIYPGQYAEPSAPRLSTPIASPGAFPTPILTLDTPPLAVGASNSTLENATGSPVYYNQPLMYEPGVQYVQASSSAFGAKLPGGLWRKKRNRPGCRDLSDGLRRGPTGRHRSSKESKKDLHQSGRRRSQRCHQHNQISWQGRTGKLARRPTRIDGCVVAGDSPALH